MLVGPATTLEVYIGCAPAGLDGQSFGIGPLLGRSAGCSLGPVLSTVHHFVAPVLPDVYVPLGWAALQNVLVQTVVLIIPACFTHFEGAPESAVHPALSS